MNFSDEFFNSENYDFTNGFQARSDVTLILNKYIIPVLGGTGLLINGFSLVVLSNRTLKHRMYSFLFCRSFFNMLFCLFEAGSLYFEIEQENTDSTVLYNFLILINLKRISMMAINISEVFLVINRLFLLAKKRNSFIQMNKRLNLFWCLMLSICIYFPFFFTLKIVKSDINRDLFIVAFTEYGLSDILKIYTLLIFLLETIFILLILFVLNFICVNKFRACMLNKDSLIASRNEENKTEMRFCRMTIILTTLCILVRLFHFLNTIYPRLSALFNGISETESISIKFFQALTVAILTASVCVEPFVYFRMNKNLATIIKGLFRQKSSTNEHINLSLIN